LRDIVGDLRDDCKSLLDDLKDGQLDAEQAADELLDSVADLVGDAYIATEEAARSVVQQASEDPVTQAALEARDGCSEEDGECGDAELMQFTDDTIAGGCGDWDKFGEKLGSALVRTLARIAIEVKRWSVELEEVSSDLAEEDPEKPVIDLDPQIPETAPETFSPPNATGAEVRKFSGFSAVTARAHRIQDLNSSPPQIIVEHSVDVAGVHDPANGPLMLILKGHTRDGTEIERIVTNVNVSDDCKFRWSFLDVPKGDYLVTLRAEPAQGTVGSSRDVSVR